ncbi:hypothetical protein CONLIGDRAFT_641733 [Coniochaeta ligniaria NRRL 30616]|uniref:Uncharacterized protein n=1 Tax=Coniochaeta ligniaria NRRL 30616 TaxID=1408157 RepID=A0A1J7JF61_9PEZI|nr:hypothetical protein CONLIGDRAFT_641733 [Coniochaeta ligniaria NRRL 30616]
MGLLSFLSRKSSSDKRQHDAHIITQSYQNTTARAPPVRGQYPIGGNGSRHLESLTKYHALGQSQLRLDITSLAEEPAPAPVVSTSRDYIVERPSTAPNGISLAANRPNTSKTRLRKSYLSGQLSLSSSRSEQESLRAGHPSDNFDRINSVGNVRPVEVPPRPHTARQRSNPFLITSGRGFKDILDAHSELKPLDFKSRIRASGARDYGEDVADRNIGENGLNLELPEVQAFYAQATDEDLLSKFKCVSVANMSRPYRRDAVLQSYISEPASLGSDLRTKSLNSSSAYIYQHQGAPHVPQNSAVNTASTGQNLDRRPVTSDAVSRRQSLNTHATSDAHPGSTSERSKVRRLAYRGGPPLPLSPLRDSLDMDVDIFGVTSLEHRLTSPPITKQKPDVESPQAAKDSKVSAIPADQKRESIDQIRNDGHDTRPPSSHRSFPLKPSTRRRSGTASSVVSSTKRHTTHSVKPSVASSIASYHTAIESTALAYPTQRQPADSTRVAKRASLPAGLLNVDSHDAGAAETAPSPSIKTGAARYELGNAHDNHQRTQSLTSSLRKLNIEGVSEVVPLRTSSLRNWSISSTTPTTSDTSSNPFQRPQSRNTATTSVDLGKDFAIKNASQLSVGDVPVRRSPGKSNVFNIDDYVSSDDDSLEPRLVRGEGEEELLFSTSGYGTGFQLPGLLDTLASSPPRELAVTDETFSSRPRSSASSPPGYFHKPFGGPGPPYPQRRYILDTAADDEDDEDEDDTQSWQGGDAYTTSGMSSPGRGIRHTKRLSALASHYGHPHPAPDVIEEERDMSKIDIAAAGRQRKEEKARKRAAAAAAKRRLLKGKDKERATGLEADEGHRADIEC